MVMPTLHDMLMALGVALGVVVLLALSVILEDAIPRRKEARTRKKFENWPWA